MLSKKFGAKNKEENFVVSIFEQTYIVLGIAVLCLYIFEQFHAEAGSAESWV